ncbi:MAG: hypothetical protein AAFR12_06225 [Cyanobacteria bacterium J06626_6]
MSINQLSLRHHKVLWHRQLSGDMTQQFFLQALCLVLVSPLGKFLAFENWGTLGALSVVRYLTA